MTKSYIIDRIRKSLTNEEGTKSMIEFCHEYDDIVGARFASCHSKNKNHITTIEFDRQKQQPIET